MDRKQPRMKLTVKGLTKINENDVKVYQPDGLVRLVLSVWWHRQLIYQAYSRTDWR